MIIIINGYLADSTESTISTVSFLCYKHDSSEIHWYYFHRDSR